MAFTVIQGGASPVTSARLRTPEIPAAVLRFRDRLLREGASIVVTKIGADGVDVDWLPAGADPGLEPIRASLLLPWAAEAAGLVDRKSDIHRQDEAVIRREVVSDFRTSRDR